MAVYMIRCAPHTMWSDEEWTLLPDSEGGTPVVPIVTVQCCMMACSAAECNWCGIVHAEHLLTCWDTAVSLKRHFYSSTPAAEGWQEDRLWTKGLTHSLLSPVFSLRIFTRFIFPLNFPLITFYRSILTQSTKDAAPTLQVVSREVHA